MAALPYIQLYVSDYLADTMHLTTEEHGAYLLLIFNYWQTGKPIPKTRLSRIARLPNDRWNSVEASLSEFFNDNGTEWVHDRIERDLEMVHGAQAQRIAAGKASAEARKRKKQANEQREVNARSTSVKNSFNENSTNKDTDTDTDTDKEKNKKKTAPREKPLPDDFEITNSMREWASKQNFTIDIYQATEKWKNAMLAGGRKYKDWIAAWRNGMIKAQEWANNDQAKVVPLKQEPVRAAYPRLSKGY